MQLAACSYNNMFLHLIREYLCLLLPPLTVYLQLTPSIYMWKRAWTKDNSFHSPATPTVFDRPQRSFSENFLQFSSLGQKSYPNLKKYTFFWHNKLFFIPLVYSPLVFLSIFCKIRTGNFDFKTRSPWQS